MKVNSPATSHLFALDSLRFVTALMVMFHHYYAIFLFPAGGPVSYQLAELNIPSHTPLLALHGWVGVEIFFVISGYVIAMSAQSGTVIDFVIKRFLRLWPIAFICASLTAIALVASGFRNELLVTAWIHSATLFAFDPQIDSSYWTLGIEVSFYALVACIMCACQRRDKILLIGLVIGSASTIFNLVADTQAAQLRSNQLLQLSYGCFFALGIALCHWHMGVRKHIALLSIPLWLVGTFAAIRLHSDGQFELVPIEISSATTISLFLIGVVIIAAAPAIQTRWAHHVNFRIFSTLGLMTYPIYLLHQVIGVTLIGTAMRMGANYYVASLIAAATILSAGFILVRYIEPPIRIRLRTWISLPRLATAT